MNDLEIALCDLNEDYILRFASYLMSELNVGIHIFTTTESFFSYDGSYDVTIMTEEFEEISDFMKRYPSTSGASMYVLHT